MIAVATVLVFAAAAGLSIGVIVWASTEHRHRILQALRGDTPPVSAAEHWRAVHLAGDRERPMRCQSARPHRR